MDTEYWEGVALFSMMLLILIVSVFGVIGSVGIVALAYLWGDVVLGILGAFVFAISLTGSALSYFWFTDPV